MSHSSAPSHDPDRRHAHRVEATGMRVAVSPRGFFSDRLVDCQILDISHGGIGISSDSLNLRPLQHVRIHLACRGMRFYAQGVVSYRQPGTRVNQYGIIFVTVPRELDQLISSLIGTPVSVATVNTDTEHATPVAELAPGTQRRLEPRFHTSRLGVGVRRTGWHRFGAFEPCTLQDISRGGLSFLCNNPGLKVMQAVEVELSHGRHSYHARATVCHSHVRGERCRYGVEFTAMSPALVRLIEELGREPTEP